MQSHLRIMVFIASELTDARASPRAKSLCIGPYRAKKYKKYSFESDATVVRVRQGVI
jgi:hypothetical protein